MLGKTNTNVTLSGPTYNLNGELFGYPTNNIYPIITAPSPLTVTYGQYPNSAMQSNYTSIRSYRIGGPYSFSYDFQNVVYRYKMVTVQYVIHVERIPSLTLSNNGEEIFRQVYSNTDPTAYYPIFNVTIDLDVDPIIKGTMYTPDASSLQLYILTCVGYLR